MYETVTEAEVLDCYSIQRTNLQCLPENYQRRFLVYHLVTCPRLCITMKSNGGASNAYLLTKVDREDREDPKSDLVGYLTSLAVLHQYRENGTALRLITTVLLGLQEGQDVNKSGLHVRELNTKAMRLYIDNFKYEKKLVEKGYYADGEDALKLLVDLRKIRTELARNKETMLHA